MKCVFRDAARILGSLKDGGAPRKSQDIRRNGKSLFCFSPIPIREPPPSGRCSPLRREHPSLRSRPARRRCYSRLPGARGRVSRPAVCHPDPPPPRRALLGPVPVLVPVPVSSGLPKPSDPETSPASSPCWAPAAGESRGDGRRREEKRSRGGGLT